MLPNLVNLTVNPCKMCMPMGAVGAMYGIRGCVSMLHGSQGCATYIRRHMATHYNEPIDIASSSLTEHGTVFGGEENLIIGLKNLMDLYNPEVIGVCTTCLAETIGEDVGAIIKKFHAQNPDLGVKIINVASPGYGGTQNDGWFAAIRAVLEQVEPVTAANGKVNIITPHISPADTRWLKGFLERAGIDFILLPDISENLDGPTEKPYNRLKTGGTPLSEIAAMAGSRITIEFSEYTDAQTSPAAYLRDEYDVPCVNLPLPVGIRGMNRFIETLAHLGGKVTDEMKKERGRYMDAMVDSHKYNAMARAAVFGEPDFVTAIVRLCCENGIKPILAATGSVAPKLREALAEETKICADYHFSDGSISDGIKVLDDCDFSAIEKICRDLGANILIGSSDARRIAHKMKLPLIRCAFPIHDHIGGQRVRTLGFTGSLNLLDQTANAMLEKRETTFRESAYKYFNAGAEKKKHPCFGEHACDSARIHLAVAPKCNIECNYCVRNYDCANENRPGVASKLLSPAEALTRYKEMKETLPNLAVVGIAGPGDALANFEVTSETLRLIRDFDPDVTFCIATNGLLLPQCVPALKELGVRHVTVTVNAVDPAIGAEIYRKINYLGGVYTGAEGAAILMANQLAGIRMLSEAGMDCKVNCVTLKGVNDEHIPEVIKKVSGLGAVIANIMPHIPVKGSAFEGLEIVGDAEISALRKECGAFIRQMSHCKQCRSDAAGTLENSTPKPESRTPEKPQEQAQGRFAVATKSGTLVDLHFGHADVFHIYDVEKNIPRFLETRDVKKYCTGPECDDKEDRWASVLRALEDCDAVLALRIGNSPEKRLKERGIKAICTYDRVETAVTEAALDIQTRGVA